MIASRKIEDKREIEQEKTENNHDLWVEGNTRATRIEPSNGGWGEKGIEVVLNILNNGLRLVEISRKPMGMESSAFTQTGVSIRRLKV